VKVSTRCRGRSPLFSRNFFSSARREFPRFLRSSRLSAERDGREDVHRLSRGRLKKAANDTTLREMCGITDYYDLARMRNGHLRAIVITDPKHTRLRLPRVFYAISSRTRQVIARDQRVAANLLIAIITARPGEQLIKCSRCESLFFFSLSKS